MTSTFKAGTGDCGCGCRSLSGSACAGLYGVFPTIFVLYSNYLAFEALLWASSISIIILKTSWCYGIILTIL